MHRFFDPAEKGDAQSHAVIGAAFAVHGVLGCGFLEAVYQEALAIELQSREIPFVAEAALAVRYGSHVLRQSYRVDFICYNALVVELKAIKSISPIETAQVFNYMKASGLKRALLLNFGAPSLEIKRFANS